jgi:hypothetical protein
MVIGTLGLKTVFVQLNEVVTETKRAFTSWLFFILVNILNQLFKALFLSYFVANIGYNCDKK